MLLFYQYLHCLCQLNIYISITFFNLSITKLRYSSFMQYITNNKIFIKPFFLYYDRFFTYCFRFCLYYHDLFLYWFLPYFLFFVFFFFWETFYACFFLVFFIFSLYFFLFLNKSLNGNDYVFFLLIFGGMFWKKVFIRLNF